MPDPAAGDSRRPARRAIVSGMTGYRACRPRLPRRPGAPWPPAEFRVLGPFEVIAAGGPVPVSPRERTLLNVLLLFCGQPCPQDLLLAALWGDAWPPTRPRAGQVRGAGRAGRPACGNHRRPGLYQATARAGSWTWTVPRFRRRPPQPPPADLTAQPARGHVPAVPATPAAGRPEVA